MLTRQQRTIVREAGNPFMPGSGNPYSAESNPYTQKGPTQPVNGAPAKPQKAETAPKNTAEDQMDRVVQDGESAAKKGYLHAIACLPPASEDLIYMSGYDEGLHRLALHHLGVLQWEPFGAGGVRSDASRDTAAYILPREATVFHQATGSAWFWWVEASGGIEIAHGYEDNIEAAQAGAEQAILSMRSTARLSDIVADVQTSNPDLDPRDAMRIARKAASLARRAGA